MDIRRASMGDLDALLRLYEQLSAGNAGSDRERALKALAAMLETPNLTVFVAETGKVVGTVTVVVVPNLTHDAKPWAQVENMVVEAGARGFGAGRLLINECLRVASAAGCYKVQLQSGNQRNSADNDAHGFYRHLGFEPSSVGFRYYFQG